MRFGNVFRDDSRAILANTAFYSTQAFVVDDPTAGYCGGAGQPACAGPVEIRQSSISLTVNGKRQSGNIVYTYTGTNAKDVESKANLFDFPNGLPGNADGSPLRYVFVFTFTLGGKVIGTYTHNVDVVASCQYGTTNGLLCAGT